MNSDNAERKLEPEEAANEELQVIHTDKLTQASDGEESEELVREPAWIESHFWVCTYPYFEASMFLFQPEEKKGQLHAYELYDVDGALVNSGEIAFPFTKSGMVDLGPLLGKCKLESGIKHAHLKLRSPAGSGHLVRLLAKERACMLQPLIPIREQRSNFLPITLGPSTQTFANIVNFSPENAQVRMRLFIGKRTPEHVVELPGNGSRSIQIDQVFADYLPEGLARTVAYIRVSTRSENAIGLQALEQVDVGEMNRFFQSYC